MEGLRGHLHSAKEKIESKLHPQQQPSAGQQQPQTGQPSMAGQQQQAAGKPFDINTINITQNLNDKKFECILPNNQTAYLSYNLLPQDIAGKKCAELTYLLVPEEFRSKGIGLKLTCRFLDWCKTNDYNVKVSQEVKPFLTENVFNTQDFKNCGYSFKAEDNLLTRSL